VVDGFLRLRHDAIVGCDDENYDVGDLGASGAHASEGFVAGRVDENYAAVVNLDFVGADVLRDAARFAARNVSFANGIEQTGFAVIDVTHDGDHGRTWLEVFFGFFLGHLEHHFVFE
jgi:hypothetical protein